MLGVILCGGESTRLGNKTLLPMRDGRPVIASSIDLLRNLSVEQIVLADGPEFLNTSVVRALNLCEGVSWSSFTDWRRGYMGAISSASVLAGDQDVVVVCGDNIYDVEAWDGAEGIGSAFDPPKASVFYAGVNEERAAHLLLRNTRAVENEKWFRPDKGGSISPAEDKFQRTSDDVRDGLVLYRALATPWIFQASWVRTTDFASYPSIEALLNAHPDIREFSLPGWRKWLDMGTISNYTEYLR